MSTDPPENASNPVETDAPQAQPYLHAFFILWGGQALSLLGTQAVQFALVWWLTVETGSALILASATLVALLPRAIAGAFIGTLVDRWDRRRVMLAADSLLALAAAVLALLFSAGAAEPWHVLILIAVRGIGSAFHEAAMLASTTLMVPPSALTRVQGFNQALQGLMMIAAPPIGALLVASLPMAGVLSIDVLTALFAILPLLFILVPQPRRNADTGSTSSVWTETADGLRYLAAQGGHLTLLAIAALVNLFLAPAFSLLPLLLHEQGAGPLRLGWASSSVGIGLLLGGLALGVWGGFERRIATTLAGMVATGLAVLLLVAVPAQSVVFLFALLLVGAMSAMVNGPIQAIVQTTIPPDMQGRVFALYGSLATIAAPVGLVLAGPVAEGLGVQSWYIAGGAVAAMLGATGFGLPALMHIEGPEGARSSDRERVGPTRSEESSLRP